MTGGEYGKNELSDAGTVLHAQGHDITAYSLSIGWNGAGAILLL